MARRVVRHKRKVVKKVNLKCFFCESDAIPDYKDPAVLRRYMTERGKVLGRSRTGLCAKHQKNIRKEILRARFLAMLPYVVKSS
jgi:small subunit ribosomal protein S18